MSVSREPRWTKDEFLASIRHALGRPVGAATQPPVPPTVDESLARLAMEDDDLRAMFAQRAAAVGMIVHETSEAALPETLVKLLKELNARSISLAIDRLPNAAAITNAVRHAGVQLRMWEQDRAMEVHYEADAGVTDVHAALAETGTLICCSDAAHGRGLSLVPAIHIAIVRRTDILPDLLDYMARNQDRSPVELPSAQALITGPSKTADIEGILITGVHGPEAVHILLAK